MPDYALMNQCLYEGKAKEVEEMTRRRPRAAGQRLPLADGLHRRDERRGRGFQIQQILYVPEVLYRRARDEGRNDRPRRQLLSAKDSVVQPAGVLVMGTVRGDLQ